MPRTTGPGCSAGPQGAITVHSQLVRSQRLVQAPPEEQARGLGRRWSPPLETQRGMVRARGIKMPRYPPVILAVRITVANRSVSRAMNDPKSAGDRGFAVAP